MLRGSGNVWKRCVMDQNQEIADLLAAFGGSQDSFATKFTVLADPLIEVDGVGPISLPITSQAAHRLCAQAVPASHGYKDQTRIDARVRDTWEISGSQVHFRSPRWPEILSQCLDRIRRELDLPPSGHLIAELDKLLIYGPGQFFVTHQDSEKADGMLASLVISLPSEFSGGEFRVTHQDRTLRSRGSAGKLSVMAFYADCQHEVRPVNDGYRVVLTYKLILDGARQPEPAAPQDVSALVKALQQFWDTPRPGRWSGDPERPPPDRLVFLLDHQYTQQGLSWSRLKGADRTRAMALRTVAEQLNAEMALALAEIHEIWSAEFDEDPYHHRSRSKIPEEDILLQDLIDDEVELRHWCGYEGEILMPATSRVSDHELCYIRPTVEFDPFESEYEGYMGNYGNTMDRWYHRAAIVLWPKTRRFIMQARQAPLWGLQEIDKLLQAGQRGRALECLQALMPYWKTSRGYHDDQHEMMMTTVLSLAVRLNDPSLAHALLAPFWLEDLKAESVPDFFQLVKAHGPAWGLHCLEQWRSARRDPTRFSNWIAETLPALALGACSNSDGTSLTKALTKDCWHWLQEDLAPTRKTAGQLKRIKIMQERAPALLALLNAALTLQDAAVEKDIIASLHARNQPLPFLLGVLHAAEHSLSWSRLSSLHEHCMNVLAEGLATPARPKDDWSIIPPDEAPDDPSDENRQKLAQFLLSSKQQKLVWPLAKAARDNIQRWISHHDLPIRCSTLKTGSPHKLVLEKTGALFNRLADEQQRMEQELAWLRSVR